MQINLDGHHVEITPPLRDYVASKMARIEKHLDKITDIHVVLTVEKLNHKAEASIHVAGGNLFADAVNEDMYAAIDALVDKLDRQAIKYKEKFSTRR
ncbi:MAG: ribosomal subunit interface protein [Gammaproteobacteria bacterium RBG_16_57_12]|nr:MAG: ribosomal subunit interface protein [Gammaproteobacteria bacterium RBG_16_57_12]